MSVTINRKIAKRIPFAYSKANGVLWADNDQLIIHPSAKPTAIAELIRHAGRVLHTNTASVSEFEAMLSDAYAQSEDSAASLVDDVEQDMDLSSLLHELPQSSELLDSENDAPVIRMINALLSQAVRDAASDIHIEPFEHRSIVRFRVDGTLIDIVEIHRALHAALISRIKIMSSLDIAEKRLPQDGRIALRLAGHPVDIRVSTLPTGHGERVVMRLLDKQAGRLNLAQLGMAPDALAQVQHLVTQPHGIILVTGPTGSGKTTTLYAALSCIDSTVTNVMTVEDPVEYALEGISQTQVNQRIDMTFARALRAILRQDPDVIMIGEIRDLETAQIAVQASLTGHLVLATLHTNDTTSSITRLSDMGIEPFLLSSSLLGILAQRLIRTLCPHCKEAYLPSQEEKETLFSHSIERLYRPVGCDTCNHTGYKGRTGIYELLNIDHAIRGMIHAHDSDESIREYALQNGLITLREDGFRLVASGCTSLEELIRATRD